MILSAAFTIAGVSVVASVVLILRVKYLGAKLDKAQSKIASLENLEKHNRAIAEKKINQISNRNENVKEKVDDSINNNFDDFYGMPDDSRL